ncbi:MAG TPA: methionyl-tRNA formyltransferase [Firmicutes bacterium]|nr:methionyl-tRNA formyltransferase [Bacillota bacterium]
MNSALIMFMGTPEFALPSLEALHLSSHRVGAVVTPPDRPRGRGLRISYSPVKKFALKAGIKVLQPASLKCPEFWQELKEISPDLIVTAAYGKILPPALLEFPPLGGINLHASLLPAYRGAAPIHRAVMAGETLTGVTVIKMTDQLDSGEILMQASEQILIEDTAGSLHDRLAAKGGHLLLQAVEALVSGTAVPVAQDSLAASYAPPLKPEEERIDWGRSNLEIYNHIRGLNPYPGVYTGFNGKRLKVRQAAYPVPEEKSAQPGEVLQIDGEAITVGTACGLLNLLEVQPAGRPVMTAGAFSRGYDIKPGFRFS